MAKKSKTGLLQNFVAPKEASERLGVTTQTLRNWARAGKIGFITLPSGRRHYNVDALMATMGAPPPVEPVKPIQRAPEAPQPVVVEPVRVTPEIAMNPLAMALAQILADRPADAQAQIMAMLTANAPKATRAEHESAPTKTAAVDVKAAIEALAGRA